MHLPISLGKGKKAHEYQQLKDNDSKKQHTQTSKPAQKHLLQIPEPNPRPETRQTRLPVYSAFADDDPIPSHHHDAMVYLSLAWQALNAAGARAHTLQLERLGEKWFGRKLFGQSVDEVKDVEEVKMFKKVGAAETPEDVGVGDVKMGKEAEVEKLVDV